jgi:hypothetical protein
MEESPLDDLQMFATEDVLVEDLPATGALGSWGSAGTFGSTVGGCASSCSTASTFS